MKSIQSVSSEILGNDPAKLYILGGEEYGLKCRYISYLESYYHRKYEYDTVKSVLDSMSTFDMFSSSSGVYVVRYDNGFISSLNASYADMLRSFRIRGTLVLIYENDNDVAKCEKYIPEFTSVVNKVSSEFVVKYLKSDIPDMPERCYALAADLGINYGHSQMILDSMNKVDNLSIWNRLEDNDIYYMFAKQSLSSDKDFRIGVASRNCSYLLNRLEDYVGDYDSILYCVLQTLLELEKLKSSKYSDSDIRQYSSKWTIQDIYYMFLDVYDELKLWRSLSVNYKDRLIYVFTLLKFSEIPYLEEEA